MQNDNSLLGMGLGQTGTGLNALKLLPAAEFS